MRLSIALCTYNGATFLREQLTSFATQERLPDELVVCDDRSSDSTPAMLEEFARTAPFPVRLMRNPENLGYRRNFAKVTELCTGDLIAFADQDDVWYPAKLRVLEAALARKPGALGAFCDGDLIDDASRPTGRTLWQSFGFDTAAQQRFEFGGAVTELVRRNVVTGMALMVRSEARRYLREIPASWIHDGWLALLITVEAHLLACPERLVGYRIHGEQQVSAPLSGAAKLRALRQSGVGAYARDLRAKNLDEYRRAAMQFADLLAYLQREHLGDGAMLAAVRARQQHAAFGAAMLSRGRLARVGPGVAHVADYRRYSPNGLRGLARDLLV